MNAGTYKSKQLFGNRLYLILIFSAGVFFSTSAQSWTTYESEEFDLQFEIPDYWSTVVDDETVISEGDGIVFVLTAMKESSISTYELFEIQVETLDLDADGEFEEIDLEGGIHGIIGYGIADMDGEEGALILLAATLDENNYLAYIFCDPEYFEDNEDIMVDVITSLAPYEWD